MPDIFLTSDTHFGHAAMTAERPEKNWRGFDTIREHDDALIANWNAVVGPKDIVIHLGDVSIAPIHGVECISLCNGRKMLVPGNHDKVWAGNRDFMKYIQLFANEFEVISPFMRRKWQGGNFLLSHFPYDGDHHSKEDRFSQFRLRDEGLPLLCGHVHGAWDDKFSAVTGALQINVGVDVRDFKPVALEDLMAQPLGAAQ